MDNIRHLSLVGDPGEISLEKEINIRREGDEDRPLHHPSHPIHLLTLQRESLGDRNIPPKREEGDIHPSSSSSFSSVSHSRIRDYGRYQINRYSPQVVQDPQVPQPEEVPNIQTMTPEQVISRPSRDSGSDNEPETWSFVRAINEVFRPLPPKLCPRQTEEHAPAKPLSGIELLMESQSAPLILLPQSKLIENTTKFLQDRINSEKCGKEWVCPPNLVSALTQTKFYKSHS